MTQLAADRPPAPAAADGGEPGGPRRSRRWLLLPVLAFVVAACVTLLATGALNSLAGVPSPVGQRTTVAAGGSGVMRVTAAGQVRPGPGFSELNGVADGLGSLWVTGGSGFQNHILYEVQPASGRIVGRVQLSSKMVINPNDIAVGSGAVWVAVGASVYRVEPTAALVGHAGNRPFAALPSGSSVIGDLVVDAGALWVSDTMNGKVYRFAAATGRLEAVIRVGSTVGAMAVGDGGVWVADADAHTVSRISVTDNRVDSVRKFPGAPVHIAASDNGVWVTDSTGNLSAAINGDHGRIVAVPVGGEPTGLTAVGDTVWVASTANGKLSRIDARRQAVVATAYVGTRPYAVAADRRGAWVSVLGRPVMMHIKIGPSHGGALTWLLRLCGF